MLVSYAFITSPTLAKMKAVGLLSIDLQNRKLSFGKSTRLFSDAVVRLITLLLSPTIDWAVKFNVLCRVPSHIMRQITSSTLFTGHLS